MCLDQKEELVDRLKKILLYYPCWNYVHFGAELNRNKTMTTE